ncbi:MAG: hypothetical protein M0Z48_02040 [Nitrospiraceae bacterium]|nr:hypothetical protein [Nitrospiraceae bacterium]
MGALVSAELLALCSRHIESHLGLYFPRQRAGELERALRGAAADLGFRNPEACIRSFMLRPVTRAQIEALARHLTVGETYFFRERKSFDVLKERILPDLIQSRREDGRYLRIWSAGCATGEEPYSMAILLHSMVPDFGEWNISILATDINPSFLQKAARGIYGEWSFRDVPSSFKERYFRRVAEGRFELLPGIRETVIFQYHNLAEDACPSLANNTNAMDIIICRNVLMYFSREVRKEVGRKLYRGLVEGGWLVVSPVEASAELFSSFSQVNFPGATLYRKDARKIKTGPPFISQTIEPYTGIPPKEKESPAKNFEPPASAPSGDALASHEQGRRGEAGEETAPLAPGDYTAPSLARLARLYANQGKLGDALGLCEKAICIDKLNPGLYYLLAAIQQEMGLLEESARSLKRVLYLDPEFVLAYFALGDLARRQGRTGESRKQFENALSAIARYGQDELIAESEGIITAGRLAEIIRENMRGVAAS